MRALATALLLVGGVALANQVHYEEVDLSHLYSECNTVAVVHDAPGKPWRTVTVGVSTPKKKAPPFSYREYHVVIDEVMKGDKEILGKTIWVKDGGWADELDQHRLYHLDGISESPIYRQYTAKYKGDGVKRVLFMSPTGKTEWQLTMQGSVEGLDVKAKIHEFKRSTFLR